MTKIDPKEKVVTLEGGELSYDYLVVALGSETEYFGIPGMKEYGMTLKSVDEARLIRTHIERCFAEYPLDPRPELLTLWWAAQDSRALSWWGRLPIGFPDFVKKVTFPGNK